MPFSILWIDGAPYDGTIAIEKSDFWKTKDVFRLSDTQLALRHNGVLTAYDNPEFTGFSADKWVSSAYVGALMFKRLESAWIHTTHQGILNSNTTLETPLDMLPFEIIWRRYNVAWNSWEKRNPNNKYKVGEKYDEIIYEACLKWSVVTEKWETVHDPFLILDADFQPQLNIHGLPRLTHSKTGEELKYNSIVHPNKWWDMSFDAVREATKLFTQRSWEIRDMTERVQEVVFGTYYQTGRLNGDGKIEFGIDSSGRLRIGDELELDTVRNMSIQEIKIDDKVYRYDHDLLWRDLRKFLWKSPEKISQIITARHSGKQHFRDQVEQMKDAPYDDERKAFNNQAAENTTREIYIPVAQALSDRFGEEVWFILWRK